VPLPAKLTPRQAMAIGTAGYTAMLCVLALEKHGIRPQDGEILVTGANGGVGSVSHRAARQTRLPGRGLDRPRGRSRAPDGARRGGGDRSPGTFGAGKPIGKERWAGVIDTVGSHTLANACATTRYRGAVAACGLAGGMDFPATVAPFILRGVTLYGIDSVMAPLAVRQEAWARLGKDLDIARLDAITREIGLSEAIAARAANCSKARCGAGRRRCQPIASLRDSGERSGNTARAIHSSSRKRLAAPHRPAAVRHRPAAPVPHTPGAVRSSWRPRLRQRCRQLPVRQPAQPSRIRANDGRDDDHAVAARSSRGDRRDSRRDSRRDRPEQELNNPARGRVRCRGR
jgi:hypothetical protein